MIAESSAKRRRLTAEQVAGSQLRGSEVTFADTVDCTEAAVEGRSLGSTLPGWPENTVFN